MKYRHVLAAALVLPLLAGVTAADAATKKKPKPKPKPKPPACNLVKDNPGDATSDGFGVTTLPNDPNMDILTADVAANATTLTTVIRLAGVDGSNTTAPLGRDYLVSFIARSTQFEIVASISAVNSWHHDKGTGVVDAAKKEIRVHVPMANLPVALKPGDVITQLKASAWRAVGPGVLRTGLVDTGVGTGTYVVGSPSCVTPGV